MKRLSKILQSIIESQSTDLVTCVRLGGRGGNILRMTDSDFDLNFENSLYRSDITFTRSAVTQTATLEGGDTEINGIVSDETIAHQFRTGVYDEARAEVFLVSAGNPFAGEVRLVTGLTGSVKIDTTGRFEMEVKDIKRALTANIEDVYQPECRADLSDSLCTVDLADYTSNGSVSAVTEDRAFTAFSAFGIMEMRAIGDDSWFAYGVLTWLTGNNAGVRVEVRSGSSTAFVLAYSLPAAIEVGDTFSVYAGCDKRIETCRAKFSNVINFQGEPDMPGDDFITDYIVPPLG